jgi:putative membrane protein
VVVLPHYATLFPLTETIILKACLHCFGIYFEQTNQNIYMKKHLIKLLSASLVVSMIACNNSGDSVKTANDSNEVKQDSITSNNIPTSVSEMDSRFMVSAANAGMTEVELGKLATQKAASEKVKSFGQMMVDDHTRAGNELKAIASARNVTLPDSLSEKSKKHFEELSGKSGSAFDKAYINMMTDGHKDVIKDFEVESKNGNDQEVLKFVTNTLPVIKSHAAAAEAIKKEMKY